MKILITILLLLTVTNANALEVIYRYVTLNIPNDQINKVGEFTDQPFMVEGVDKWMMVFMHDDFELRSCPHLAKTFPKKNIDCKQSDRIALLDKISTDPQLQIYFNVRDGKPEITRTETEDYVLYSAIRDESIANIAISMMYIKQKQDTISINGNYSKEQLKTLNVADWLRARK